MLTLSPQGRAVASLVLAFTLLTGTLNRAAFSVVGLLDLDIGDKGAAIFATILIAALCVGVLLYARGAVDQDGWGAPLAQAACVLALVALAIAAIGILTALVQGGHEAFYPGNG